jgi:hypothetical protein
MARPFWRIVISLTVLMLAQAALADHEHSSEELEVFLALEAIHGSGQQHPGDDADTWFDADTVFGLTANHFRVFGEFYVTPDEHDLERLQFGFEVVPETVFWLGRFHQPASAWNTEHHHGRYLQTAISRPFIERWEDEDGLIPQHITGALIESRRPVGEEGAIQISGGVGAGPGIGHDGESHDQLLPIDLIGANPGRHRLSLTSRVAYLPEFTGTSSAGLLLARDELSTGSPTALPILGTSNLILSVYGAYADWSAGLWRVISTYYYVDIDLAQVHHESFMSGYAQLERQLPFKLTAFSRLEDSARMQESRYVRVFDDEDGDDINVAVRRVAIGLRWDFIRRQALTVELSHVDSLTQRSDEIRLQWSGVIP